MADLGNAIQNIWSSDFVQKNPTKAYKSSYGSEYSAVAAYLNGGVRPNPANYTKLGKGLVEAEDVRRAAAPPPPPPPPPATGTLFDRLTSFGDGYLTSDLPSGQTNTLENRWAPRSIDGNPAFRFSFPSYVGTPYSTIGAPAIQEISTPYGGGFKFLCSSQSVQPGSGALTFINDTVGYGDQSHGGHVNANEGVTEDWSGKFYFPSAGNVNGFEPVAISAVLWEFHSTGNSSGHFFGLEPNVPSLAGHRLRWGRQLDVNQNYAFTFSDSTSAPPSGFVTMDTWHSWRMLIKWSTGGSGFLQCWYDEHLMVDFTGPTMFGDGHNLHFGIYRDDKTASIHNEVWHADIRKQ